MPHSHHGVLGSAGSVLLTIVFVITAMVYLRGWFQLRRALFIVISLWPSISFVAGLFLIWIAVASPIAALDHELLTVHMLQHLLLMTLAPPLIWLGNPIKFLLYGLPPPFVYRFIAPASCRPWVKRVGSALGNSKFCWLAAAAVLVVWHIPAVFAVGMHSEAWHLIEQGSFLATGLLFWWPVVQPWPSISTPDLSIILYLFLATIPCDILSGFLVFCDRVVYPAYLSSSHLFGVLALGDQQFAAALMWTCVTVVYLIAGAVVTMHLLSPRISPDHIMVQGELWGSALPRTAHSLEAVQHGD
jgi:putative membrane protein